MREYTYAYIYIYTHTRKRLYKNLLCICSHVLQWPRRKNMNILKIVFSGKVDVLRLTTELQKRFAPVTSSHKTVWGSDISLSQEFQNMYKQKSFKYWSHKVIESNFVLKPFQKYLRTRNYNIICSFYQISVESDWCDLTLFTSFLFLGLCTGNRSRKKI